MNIRFHTGKYPHFRYKIGTKVNLFILVSQYVPYLHLTFSNLHLTFFNFHPTRT